MPRVEDYRLHPWGWETDPETERFKLSTFDFLSTTTWTINALFFRVTDNEKPVATAAIREGLERTFSQIRHYVGTIEQDEDGGYSVIKKKDSTVKFVVQHLDGPEDSYPTFDDIAEAHYLSPILGDVGVLINKCMVRGNIPEAQPHNHPEICSYKVNLIRGGIIFVLHQHHWVNGLTGGFAFHKQLALNCYASFHKTPIPFFDPKWLDREQFGLPGFDRSSTSSEPEMEVAPRAQQNMQLKPSSSLMFHLRKSKAAELKKAATPPNGTRVSTYDATCALMWRSLCKVRAPLYKPGPDYQLLWGQGVSFSKLFKDPPLPAQLQGNLQFDITSLTSPVPQLSLAEVLSKAPLSELALYTRRMTDSVTVGMLFERINAFKRIKNQHDLSILVDSFPPMSILMTDWRSYDLCSLDFGFGRAPGWRHLFCGVPLSLAVVYPPHRGPAGDDEGFEVQIVLETELIPRLLEDPEWSKYFEFRGVDAAEDMDTSDLKPKL